MPFFWLNPLATNLPLNLLIEPSELHLILKTHLLLIGVLFGGKEVMVNVVNGVNEVSIFRGIDIVIVDVFSVMKFKTRLSFEEDLELVVVCVCDGEVVLSVTIGDDDDGCDVVGGVGFVRKGFVSSVMVRVDAGEFKGVFGIG
ncbi:hypothetical protein Tco_0345229 [Tanacetum coccineum]